jgi:hypothetical protein
MIPTFYTAHARVSNANSMDHNARIQKAIDDLKSQSRTNFAATARRWKVERITLAKRFYGETETI